MESVINFTVFGYSLQIVGFFLINILECVIFYNTLPFIIAKSHPKGK